jgi:hypothetical protein
MRLAAAVGGASAQYAALLARADVVLTHEQVKGFLPRRPGRCNAARPKRECKTAHRVRQLAHRDVASDGATIALP